MKKVRGKKKARAVEWKSEWKAVSGHVVRRRVEAGFSLMEYCRLRREEVGMTQRELEGLIGRKAGWMSWAEANVGAVPVGDIERMLAGLGVRSVAMERD